MNRRLSTIIYIDMDDTICDFKQAIKHCRQLQFPQSKIGFFENLKPIDGAINGVNFLREQQYVDVYILTAPSIINPHCYTEKRLWIEKYFDLEFCKKLIICNNKALLKGDYLVDDYKSGKGQENFEGKLIHYASKEFKTWVQVLDYFTNEVIYNQIEIK